MMGQMAKLSEQGRNWDKDEYALEFVKHIRIHVVPLAVFLILLSELRRLSILIVERRIGKVIERE
jgi:hypothetical protein